MPLGARCCRAQTDTTDRAPSPHEYIGKSILRAILAYCFANLDAVDCLSTKDSYSTDGLVSSSVKDTKEGAFTSQKQSC